MKAQIRILTGSRAGVVHVFSAAYVAIGRHGDSDLPFDPETDLDVSARHAALLKKGDRWYVRDLSSRNGTLVNGHKISHDTKLDETDQIKFGGDGPLVEFRMVGENIPDTAKTATTGRDGAEVELRRTASHSNGSTTERIRVEVERQTRSLKRTTVTVMGILVLASATFFAITRRQKAALEGELTAMQARTDSILATASVAVSSLEGQMAGLVEALRRSQAEVTEVKVQLERAREAGNSSEVAQLRRQLQDATAALARQQLAASIDFRHIRDANHLAVAMIYVEYDDGEVFTASAFSVRRDATLITTRHVVAGDDGRSPRRIAIQFADSDQVWPARVLAISEQADLAVVKADNILGDVPTIHGFSTEATAVQAGDPVAVIGFPLGDDLPMWNGRNPRVVSSTLTAGTVSKVLPDLVQIDGYGAEGASGSPILNAAGEVVAILFGGQEGSGGRIVFGVPASLAVGLLDALP